MDPRENIESEGIQWSFHDMAVIGAWKRLQTGSGMILRRTATTSENSVCAFSQKSRHLGSHGDSAMMKGGLASVPGTGLFQPLALLGHCIEHTD